jgi:uncharacterized membrane protein HdeD (DUF308 family)
MFLRTLAKKWWLLALRGLLAVLFGLVALIWSQATLGALVLLFGAFTLVDGVINVASAFGRGRQGAPAWWVVIQGLFGIIVGVVTFIWPEITALVLLYLIAGWALITGIIEILAAIQLRKELQGEWLLGLGGLLSLIFGLLVIIWPSSGATALMWMIGVYATIFGFIVIGLGFRLRQWHQSTLSFSRSE